MSRNPVKIATTHRFPQTGLVLHGVPTGADTFFHIYSCTLIWFGYFAQAHPASLSQKWLVDMCSSVEANIHQTAAATPVPDPLVLGNAETLVLWLTLPSLKF